MKLRLLIDIVATNKHEIVQAVDRYKIWTCLYKPIIATVFRITEPKFFIHSFDYNLIYTPYFDYGMKNVEASRVHVDEEWKISCIKDKRSIERDLCNYSSLQYILLIMVLHAKDIIIIIIIIIIKNKVKYHH